MHCVRQLREFESHAGEIFFNCTENERENRQKTILL